METLDIKFKGIDDWNRPVYQVVDKPWFLGDVDNLFSWSATKEEVDAFFKTGDNIKCLVIFGTTFNKGHDPLGSELKKTITLNII